MSNVISWFDIPVSDMTRAIAFYEALTGQTLKHLRLSADSETALFEAAEPGAVSGSLFASPDDIPSLHGAVVYFNASPSIDEWLARVEPAGGKILVGKTPIPGGRGFYAYFIDSEGNRVGLNAPT